MKNLKNTLAILLVSTFSCDDDNDPTNNVCEERFVYDIMNTHFTLANGYTLTETMDTETHEYTIRILSDGEICAIGYQNPSSYAGGYTMEVENVTNPTTNYAGVHSFSQANLSFNSITPVIVSNGDFIKVKRTVLTGWTNFSELIGSVYENTTRSPITYGVTQNNVEFISSNFYGAGGPKPNAAQPIIALGFKIY